MNTFKSEKNTNFKLVASLVFVILFQILCTNVNSIMSAVTSFRVYDENRILSRLATAPLVRYMGTNANNAQTQVAHRIGIEITHPPPPKKKTKRVRKVLRRVTSTKIPITTLNYDLNPLNNYNNRDIENYGQKQKRMKNRVRSSLSDLQRAESGNPFINSTSPFSPDFNEPDYNGQNLHSLFNSDSVLSHIEPKLPENKTVAITHSLNEDLDITPLAPEIATRQKQRRKYPLANQDSLLPQQQTAAKTEGRLSSQIKQTRIKSNKEGTIVLSQKIPIYTTTVASLTRRPTIRLTNPTTTTLKPTTVILSPITQLTTTTTTGPPVILFPPEDKSPIVTTPQSAEEEIIKQLLSLSSGGGGEGSNENIFDLLNLFHKDGTSTNSPTTTSEGTTIGTSQAEVDSLLQAALLQGLLKSKGEGGSGGLTDEELKSIYAYLGTQRDEEKKEDLPQVQTPPPPPKVEITPTTTPPSLSAALSNMINILSNPFGQGAQGGSRQTTPSIFGGANNNLFGSGGSSSVSSLFGNNGGGGGGLFSTGGLFGTQNKNINNNNNLASLFGGSTTTKTTNNGIFSNAASLFGSGSNLFGGLGNLGSSSLFKLNDGAASSTTEVVVEPTTKSPFPTKGVELSENELLNQLIQLGLSVEQEKGNSLRSTPAPYSNENNLLGRVPNYRPPQPQPSETMQLLNILFNQNKVSRPSGPYWWLDMNAFMGNNANGDPLGGFRPKVGQKDYFIKVT